MKLPLTSLVLFLLCTTMLVSHGSAFRRLPPAHRWAYRTDQGSNCRAALHEIPDCAHEIVSSHRAGRMGPIRPSCCKAFRDIKNDCSLKLFDTPFFRQALLHHCSKE
ncbi:Dwarfin sma-2 like [Actinidia chinensis var. chinensis]|uniref:Dwarfin sma-2 like n=1 Tax=Actinidia chinensis var. chinensis TaxID=1590841 RepID=A0A2R6PVR7_ACTCC|nr:Dwarfin sma-2 like [Actinidia chinensis var. chinensis]